MAGDVVPKTFRALSANADRKFARVRDVPAYGRPCPDHYFHRVFKSYMRLWKYQQEHRQKLVESGLRRWEIGEIASRIGQLYFGQYMRTSEARFLLESYIFYEAIFHRGYFRQQEDDRGDRDRGVRFKELRFYARFLLVSLVLNRTEMVKILVERFSALVEDSLANFKETSFKEWKLVVQEIVRFMKADTAFVNVRPLRYCAMFDSYPASLSYVSRFHAKKVLKFQDALLTSYHRNEVKFAELTLDTFRMLQCLEWEPSGSFYQKHPVESHENGSNIDYSATSGLIDINLAADMTDPNLPPNPKKAILYRPSVTHLMAVIATICEELPPECVILVYLSATGKARHPNVSEIESSGVLKKSSKLKVVSHTSHGQNNLLHENHVDEKGNSGQCLEDSLFLGPSRDGGSNCLYPGDLIPFTRRPLFLIIDSDISHAFKVLHGSERGEPAALLLSPLKPSFKCADVTQSGSQFTLFLTAPLQAFCELVGLTYSDSGAESYNDADNILQTSFSKWEVILCTSTTLDLVWAQVLSDPFLRRLILRFIFCRSVLAHFGSRENKNRDRYLPVCLPQLLDSLSPNSEVVQSAVFRLANHLDVADCFHLNDR